MGVVYKAEDTKLHRTVALKFLPPELNRDEEAKHRFIHEAQAASSLQHHNVCTIHDIDETEDGQMFICMDFYEGKTLKQKIGKGPLKIDEAIDITIQVADGLSRAHEEKIIHRDIKTANIFITDRNEVKILDFGLAKVTGQTQLTQMGTTVGTVAYLSPEQARGEKVDHRTDLWSLGVVLYEMITGQLPFKGEYEQAVIYSIMNEEPEPMTSLRSNVPMELERIIKKCLEKDASNRYQHSDELLVDLRWVKRETSKVTPSVTTALRPPGEVQEIRKVPKEIRWTAAVVIVLVLCITGWLLFHPEPRRAVFKAGRSSQLTSEPGIEIDPALSPDGKMIAYSSYFKGTLRVHVKQVTGGRTICLTEEMPGYQRFPQWSTDGSEIAFTSYPFEARYVVPALGGAPRKIAAGVWSPDDKRTAFVSGDTIYTQAVDGDRRETLAVIYDPHSLSWSPDGSLIAFVSGNSGYLSSFIPANFSPSSIRVVNVSNGSLSQITDNSSINMSPVWANDGRHLFFVSNRDGVRDIYSIPLDQSGRPAGTPDRLTTGSNAYTIGLSADSRTLIFPVLTFSANIWSIRIPLTNAVSVKEATQVTTGNQAIETLDVSANGQWLVYDSNLPGNQDIFKVMIKGGEPIRLTRDSSEDFSPSWSPDGKMIAFHSFRTGNRDLFTMLNDGSQQQQITHDPAQERYADWSPDGNQLVFYSDKSGQQEIYVMAKKPGSSEWETPRQITYDGGWSPRWSPNGLWIAYIRNGLCVISPRGGTPRVLVSDNDPSILSYPVFPGWSSDSRTVYYKAADESQRASFWSFPLSGGKPRLLVRFDDPTRQSNRPEFATDGKRFFFTVSNYQCDIWRMELIKEE